MNMRQVHDDKNLVHKWILYKERTPSAILLNTIIDEITDMSPYIGVASYMVK